MALRLSSVYVSRWPACSTATASGVLRTWPSNSSAREASCGYSAGFPLQSCTSRRRSTPTISGSASNRCSGRATADSRSTRRCPNSRSMVVGSNRSLLNSSAPATPPSPDAAIPSVRSNFDVLPDDSAASNFSPGRLTAEPGAFCSTNITWKSALRLMSRSGCSCSTSLSKGTSWCAYAPSVVSRTCLSSSRKVELPSSRARSTSVLTKKPISPSVSARVRLAMAVPTLTSSCLAYLPSTVWNAASSTMKGVAPSCCASVFTASQSPFDHWKLRVSPRKLCTAGRGLSVGSSSACGAPVSCCFQYASCASSTSPFSHSRCHTA